MVYATLHKAHHHHTAHHYLQQTRTHLPIEKAPKIITLNLVFRFKFDFIFIFYFSFLFSFNFSATSSSTVARLDVLDVCMALSLPAYCVVACCWQLSERETEAVCVCARSGIHTKIISLKQLQFLKMVRYSHTYNQNKIHSSVDDGNRA